MSRSAFITLEGVEGVGKSTALTAIEANLCSLGHGVLVTREPGGTPLAEQIREWILDGEHGALSAEIEVLLMFAARAEHLEQLIRPALADGRWVVCDRFTDATFAYQGGGRGAPAELLDSLVAAVEGRLRPDLTLLLDAPVEVGLRRIKDRKPDHFEREDLEFFERVRQTYLDIAKREPERVKIIDAAQAIESVQSQIDEQLDVFVKQFDPNDD